MKIKTIEIYGYGKWANQLFDVAETMQIFHGKNEAGKSTLMSFIHSILFGFPTKQGSDLRYEPRNGSQYGGRLRLSETIYGEVLVERVKGRANGKVSVTLADGRTGDEDLLKKIVYGLDKNTYQALFSFNLDGLQKVHQMNESKLNRYFLSVGTLGNEHLLKIADKFQQQANKLYKPTGRIPEINQKLVLLKQKEQQLKTAKAKNIRYNQLMSKKISLTESIKVNQKKREAIEENLNQLRRLTSNWTHFDEIEEIQRQMRQEKLSNLPEDGLYQLKLVNDELERMNKEIIQSQEQLAYLSQKAGQSEAFSFYLEHKSALKEVMFELEEIKLTLQSKEVLEAEYRQTQYFLEQSLTKLGLPIYGELPSALTKETQAFIRKQLEKKQQLDEQNKAILFEEQRFMFQLESCNQEIDKLEEQLWDNKEFQEFDAESSKRTSTVSQKSREKKKTEKSTNLGYIGIGSGLLFTFIGFLVGSGIGWGIIGISLLIIFSSVYSLGNGKKSNLSKPSEVSSATSYSYEAYIKQVEIRRQWREKLAEIDELTTTLHEVSIQKSQQENEYNILDNEEQQLKERLGLPLNFSLESLTIQDPFQEIRQQMKQVEEQEVELEVKENQLTNWLNKAAFSKPMLKLASDKLSDFIFALQQYYQGQQEIEQSLFSISQQVTEVQEHLAQAKIQQQNKLKEKKDLFQIAEVTDEEAYRKKYILNQQLQQKKARLDLLEHQLKEDVTLFEMYRDEQALTESIEVQEKSLKELKVAHEEYLKERVQCEVELKSLEEGGQYSVLLQEFANIKSELQELVDKWSRLRIAAELIEETLKLARKDRLPSTIEDATYFFRKLTNRHYHRILLKDQKIKVQREDGTLFEAQELSTGTAEQLYVALRLAFVKNTADLLKMPLLIDDGFVNFDRERKSLVLQLLEELSQTNQLIYFTYENEIDKELPQVEVNVLQ